MEYSDTKPILSEDTDPNPAPPPYYLPQQQPQMVPQPQPQLAYMNNSTFIVTQPLVQVANKPPPDLMGLAIFTCLCCFMPFGLAAIVFSSQARDALYRGDLTTAQLKLRAVRLLSMLSIMFGIIGYFVVTAFVFMHFNSTSHSQDTNV